MADITTTGLFIGTGKPEPVTITVSETENEEMVDAPSVTLSVSPSDLTEGANRRVETYLTPDAAASLGQMLLDHAAAVRRAVDAGEDQVNDYAG